MRQATGRGSSRGGVCGALDSHLSRLADEVVLHPTGHQVHHITCTASDTDTLPITDPLSHTTSLTIPHKKQLRRFTATWIWQQKSSHISNNGGWLSDDQSLWVHKRLMYNDRETSLAQTLNWAWRSCWDLVDLGSRQSEFVALKLEGDGFAALTWRNGSSCQGGKLGYTHHLTSFKRRDRENRREFDVIQRLAVVYSGNLRLYSVGAHLQGSLACMSGLSRTLWGMMLLVFGLGCAGMLAVLAAAGGRTVSTGFGALDLTAVWAVGWRGGRGRAAGATEHTTTEGKKQMSWTTEHFLCYLFL